MKAALSLMSVSLVLSACSVTASEGLQVYPDGRAIVTMRVVGPVVVSKAGNDSLTAAMQRLSEVRGLPADVGVSVERVQEGSADGIEATWTAKSVKDAIAVLELVPGYHGGGILADAKWTEKRTIFSHGHVFSAKLLGSRLDRVVRDARGAPGLSGLEWSSMNNLRVEFSVTAPEPVVSAPGAKVSGNTATWLVEPGKDSDIFMESSDGGRGLNSAAVAAVALLVLIVLTSYVAMRRSGRRNVTAS